MDSKTQSINGSAVNEVRQPSGFLFGHTPKEAIESAAKIAVAFSVLAYTQGLLIVNLHLTRYGTAHFGLMHVQYIMVGVVWIFLMLLCHIPSYAVYRGWKEDHSKKRDRWFTAVAKFLFLAWLLIWAMQYLSDNGVNFGNPKSFAAVGMLIVLGAGSTFALLANIKHLLRLLMPSTNSSERLNSTIGILLLMIAQLGNLGIYSIWVYPNISPSFSGGKAQRVTLVSKPEYLGFYKDLGYVVDENTKRVGPVSMIMEFDRFILLLPPDNQKSNHTEGVKAIRVREEMVESILFFKGSDEKK